MSAPALGPQTMTAAFFCDRVRTYVRVRQRQFQLGSCKAYGGRIDTNTNYTDTVAQLVAQLALHARCIEGCLAAAAAAVARLAIITYSELRLSLSL